MITYHLLLIEDEPEKWIHLFLNPVTLKKPENLLIEYALKLEEGLSALRRMHYSIDAVLIEYHFPSLSVADVCREIKQIKSEYPTLPVFILCSGSETENTETIAQFIRAGATNFFDILHFHPEIVIAHIAAAAEQQKLRKQYDVVTTGSQKFDQIKPHLQIKETDDPPLTGYFAFLMNSMFRPKNDAEEIEFAEMSGHWHTELFRMLSILIDHAVSLSVIYENIPGSELNIANQVGIYWLFRIKAGSLTDLYNEYGKTIRDINIYFGNNTVFSGNPYQFIPVTDSATLNHIISPNIRYTYRVKRRECEIKPEDHSGIGFRSKFNSERTEFLSVFSLPDHWDSVNNFCHILQREGVRSRLEISIFPYRITDGDLASAGRFSSSLSEILPLNKKDASVFQTFLENLMSFTFRPFLVSYFFHTDNSEPNDAIKATIFNAFALDRFVSMIKHEREAILSDICQDNQLPLFIRMPLPKKEGIIGLNSLSRNMTSLPEKINSKGVLTGHKRFFSRDIEVRIGFEDLSQHAYILGQTGTGKSTMLYTMVMDLLKSGRHVSLIDPHGDLFNRIRQHLPEQFRDQTIFYDPSSQTEELPGIHYLQHDPTDPFQRSYIFNSLLTIFDNLYNLNVSGGPIFNKYFQAAINLVMLAGGGLLDVIRVFEDSEYRKMLLESNQDKETSEEWNHLTRTSGEWDFPNMSVYITSKMSEFRNNAFIRRILTPGSKQLDFDAILNKGKNLMIRLPVGTLSERGVNLIGQIIFNKFIMVAFSREKMPESQRLDHTLVVDEFHKFTTDAIGKVFAEARKYHLNLVVANQTLAQLDINLQKVLLGNVGSMLFFRPGIIDANIVSPYFEPEFSAQELCSLPNYHCAARISVDKKPSVPFVFETIPGI